MGALRESAGLAKVMEPIACERRRDADVSDDTEPDELESCRHVTTCCQHEIF